VSVSRKLSNYLIIGGMMILGTDERGIPSHPEAKPSPGRQFLAGTCGISLSSKQPGFYKQ
jgi:hypothetical protein